MKAQNQLPQRAGRQADAGGRCIRLWVVLIVTGFVHGSGTPLMGDPESPVSPLRGDFVEVEHGLLPAAATAKFRELAGRQPLVARFVETRHIPARTRPVRVEGMLRLDPDRGLSLHYSTGGDDTVVVADGQGLAWRGGRADFREVPASRVGFPGALLRTVLGGDLGRLRGRWDEAPDGNWILLIQPESGDDRGSWSGASFSGRGDQLDQIALRLERGVVVVLEITETIHLDQFSAKDLRRYFRTVEPAR